MLLRVKVFPKYISLALVSAFMGMIYRYKGFGTSTGRTETILVAQRGLIVQA